MKNWLTERENDFLVFFNSNKNKFENIRINGIKEINDGTPVFDMRDKEFYCSYCDRYSETPQMGGDVGVIFVFNGMFESHQKQIWIIKGHYDGCRGWD